MATVRLSTKGFIVLIILMSFVTFGLGYTVWKITGVPNLATTGADAGNVGSCKKKSKSSCAGSCVYNGGVGEYCKWNNNSKTCGNSGKACGGGPPPQVTMECSGSNCIKCVASDPRCGTFSINAAWGTCNEAKLQKGCSIGNNCFDLNGNGIFDDDECDLETVPLEGVITCTGCSTKDSVGCSEKDGTDIGSSHYNKSKDRIVCNGFCGSIQCDASNGHRDAVCSCDDDPPVVTNVCDGGGILEQTVTLEIGEPITVTGWAYDETGINTSQIVVTIDGKLAGNAKTIPGCPPASIAVANSNACNSTLPNVVTWSYTFTATEDKHAISVKWKDIEGKESTSCTAVQTLSRQNVCDGGGIVPQSESMEIGDLLTVRGWAYDTDGVDQSKIAISIDGALAGNATTTAGCPAQTSNCNPTDPNVITWSYSFASTKIAHVVSAKWEDTLGVTGISCNASQTFSLNLINPDWSMTKVSAGVCDESDPDNIFIPLNYVVSVTNNASAVKEISTIVDNLDPKVQESWVVVSSISPTGTLSGNTLTWNLTGDLASFEPGQTKAFTYTVIIPDDAFGTYVNTVISTPNDSSSSFSATETKFASCVQPISGLLDSSFSKVVLSSFIILMSAAYLVVDGDNLRLSKWFTLSSRMERKRKGFEDKV